MADLKTKLALNLLPPLLPLEFLSNLLRVFGDALFTLLALSLFVQCSTLHDSCYDFGGVDVLEAVVGDFAVDVQGLGDGVGIELEGHEGCFAVVDGERFRVGQCMEEGLAEGEGGTEDDGVDELGLLVGD